MALSNAELDAIPVDEMGLAIQDLAKLDIEKLTPLTREVIARQATINVGTIGHVAHGKSTVVRSLTDVKTQKHKSEKERTIGFQSWMQNFLGTNGLQVPSSKTSPNYNCSLQNGLFGEQVFSSNC